MNNSKLLYNIILFDLALRRQRKKLVVLLWTLFLWVPQIAFAGIKMSDQFKLWMAEIFTLVDILVTIIGICGAGYAAYNLLAWGLKKGRRAETDGEPMKVLYGIIVGSFWLLYALARGSLELGEGGQGTDDMFET